MTFLSNLSFNDNSNRNYNQDILSIKLLYIYINIIYISLNIIDNSKKNHHQCDQAFEKWQGCLNQTPFAVEDGQVGDD